jgi:predicted nucleotidyltransferase
MIDTVKAELDKIVEVLVGTGIVTKIILFGSHAKGTGTADSDIDLCVLVSVKDKHEIDLIVDFEMKLYQVKTMPLDLLAYNQDVFYSHAERKTSFEHEIAKEGMLIYDY